MLVVTKVREPWTSGEGQADYVEVGTGDVVLIVDVWGVQAAVRVPSDERLAGGGPRAMNGPVVRTTVVVFQPLYRGESVLQLLDAVDQIGLGLRARWHDDELTGKARSSLVAPNALDTISPLVAVPFQEAGGSLRAEGIDQLGTPGLALEHAHHDVSDLEYRETVPGPPGYRLSTDQCVLHG